MQQLIATVEVSLQRFGTLTFVKKVFSERKYVNVFATRVPDMKYFLSKFYKLDFNFIFYILRLIIYLYESST